MVLKTKVADELSSLLIHKKYSKSHQSNTCGSISHLKRQNEIECITNGVVADMPVLLAQFCINIPLTIQMDFPERVLMINNLEHTISMTQFTLIQTTNVLFIKGVLTNHITYMNKGTCNVLKALGKEQYYAADLPFQYTTYISFNGTSPRTLLENRQRRSQVVTKNKTLERTSSHTSINSYDNCEYGVRTYHYNRRPYCEACRYRIIEKERKIYNQSIDSIMAPLGKRNMLKLVKKLEISIDVQILQNLEVAITPSLMKLKDGKGE